MRSYESGPPYSECIDRSVLAIYGEVETNLDLYKSPARGVTVSIGRLDWTIFLGITQIKLLRDSLELENPVEYLVMPEGYITKNSRSINIAGRAYFDPYGKEILSNEHEAGYLPLIVREAHEVSGNYY
jgi:hypothetical protein